MSNSIRSAEGQKVPNVTFRTRKNGDWEDVSSDDLFSGRTVVLFALPGAFTPTCSSAHLPRYEELAPTFQAAGVDEVICLSVNDAFVMEAWGRDQGVEKVRMLPDGNGDFTKGVGQLVSKRDLGFGERSWRYSMLVKDGVIEKTFVEPDVPGDPYEVSDADTMLEYLSVDTAAIPNVSVFTRQGCGHCKEAKRLLDEKGLAYEEIVLSGGLTSRSLRAVAGAETVPQVFIDGKRIGGAEDLAAHLVGA